MSTTAINLLKQQAANHKEAVRLLKLQLSGVERKIVIEQSKLEAIEGAIKSISKTATAK